MSLFKVLLFAEGYGSHFLNLARNVGGQLLGGVSEFPIIPGRDFSGVVVETGKLVRASKFAPGDEVCMTVFCVRMIQF